MKSPDRTVMTLLAMLLLAFSGCVKRTDGIVTAPRGLVFRSGPSATSDRLDLLPRGTIVAIHDLDGPGETIESVSGKWYGVRIRDRDGWVFGPFIKVLKSDLRGAYQSREDAYMNFFEYADGRCEMTVNLCEGLGVVYGSCVRDGGSISCRVTERDFRGFRGDDLESFSFMIRGDRTVEYRGGGIGCCPNNGELLDKL